jgi:nucleoside phosphorylase
MIIASDIRGKVDFGILTIRDDEYTAVLNQLPGREAVRGRIFYEYSRFGVRGGTQCGVAVTRCLEQGHGAAHDTAREMIEELDPGWLLLVGIAGGVPDDGYSLGDVLLANRIYDFSVSAAILDEESHQREWNTTGGRVHPRVQTILAAIPGWEERFKGWNTQKAIKRRKPVCEVPEDLGSGFYYGPEEHRKKVRASLSRNFPVGKRPRPPCYRVLAVASSNVLVKDPELITEWKLGARSFGFVEMEAGGVYRAAQRQNREYPVLVIRGISDIVGFKRGPDWTAYACLTAASFAAAFVRSGVWTEVSSPTPGGAGLNSERNERTGAGLDTSEISAELSKLTFAEIEVVTRFVLENPATPGTDFTLLDPEEKLQRNGLTASTRELLIIGLSKVNLVRDYVDHFIKIDGLFPEKLKAGFLAEYRRQQAQGLAGDKLFEALTTFACRGETNIRYIAAALAVVTYLFELCDVFEK